MRGEDVCKVLRLEIIYLKKGIALAHTPAGKVNPDPTALLLNPVTLTEAGTPPAA